MELKNFPVPNTGKQKRIMEFLLAQQQDSWFVAELLKMQAQGFSLCGFEEKTPYYFIPVYVKAIGSGFIRKSKAYVTDIETFYPAESIYDLKNGVLSFHEYNPS